MRQDQPPNRRIGCDEPYASKRPRESLIELRFRQMPFHHSVFCVGDGAEKPSDTAKDRWHDRGKWLTAGTITTIVLISAVAVGPEATTWSSTGM